jgi:hypothetical protein
MLPKQEWSFNTNLQQLGGCKTASKKEAESYSKSTKYILNNGDKKC